MKYLVAEGQVTNQHVLKSQLAKPIEFVKLKSSSKPVWAIKLANIWQKIETLVENKSLMTKKDKTLKAT